MAEFVFDCPVCDGSISANDSLCGHPETCPHCGNEICIPIPGLEKGIVLGGFELIEHLGTGASGEVWTARQLDMDRIVALKILLPSLATNSNFINRFKKEIKHSASLNHPNIVTAYHSGNDKGIYFLAITYVDGETIAEQIKNGKVFTELEALEIIKCIAQALNYAWQEYSIIHRDIKPENIMIDTKGTPMLLDMGIAKSTQEDSGLTMTGTVIGTPYYMSPEQAIGDKEIDFRSDIYSLGSTFYHMITGTVPYNADSAMAIMMKHLNEELVSPRTYNSSISPEVEAVIKKMMAKDKNERYQSWEEVIHDIDAILKKKKPAAASGKKSSSVIVFLLIILPLILISAGVYIYFNSNKIQNIISTQKQNNLRESSDHTNKSSVKEQINEQREKPLPDTKSLNEKTPAPEKDKINKTDQHRNTKEHKSDNKENLLKSQQKAIPPTHAEPPAVHPAKKKNTSTNPSEKPENKPESPSRHQEKTTKKPEKNNSAEKNSINYKKNKIDNSDKKNSDHKLKKPKHKKDISEMIKTTPDTPEEKINITEIDKDLMNSPNTFPYTSEKLDLTKNSPEDVEEYWEEINGTEVTWQGVVYMDRSINMTEYEVRILNPLAKEHGGFNIVLKITDKQEIKKFLSLRGKQAIFSGIIYKKVHAKDNGAVTVYLKDVKFKTLF